MKWISFFLSLSVLVLSVQPFCARVNPHSSCQKIYDIGDKAYKDQNKDTGESSPTICNPFQLCGCCDFSAITINFVFIIRETKCFPSIDSWPILGSISFSEEPISGFWKPPKNSPLI